jgi:hypothetical protein
VRDGPVAREGRRTMTKGRMEAFVPDLRIERRIAE